MKISVYGWAVAFGFGFCFHVRLLSGVFFLLSHPAGSLSCDNAVLISYLLLFDFTCAVSGLQRASTSLAIGFYSCQGVMSFLYLFSCLLFLFCLD